ncbi:MAG: M14 family metallopeptidase [Cyclobacteriaceae bacterium]
MYSYLFAAALIFTAGFVEAQVPQKEKKFEGQAPVLRVDTSPRPVQIQHTSTFHFPEMGVSLSNQFEGARLNGVLQHEDTLIAWITPENTPINPSPWYAFKIWSAQPREIYVKLTYQDARHRYYPKLSQDGRHWTALDSARYEEFNKGEADFGVGSLPEYVRLRLPVGPDTLWVAGQELQTSTQVYAWMDSLATRPFITTEIFGKTRLGRPMLALTLGEAKLKDKVIVVISRQHPPEVTGYLAMKAFIETLAGNSQLARRFRKEYTVLAIPLMNPDGVDMGHWRHAAGGVDLNRDWAQQHHPEIRAVKNMLDKKLSEENGKLYFGIDFHSTWDDIFYTLDSTVITHAPGLVEKWLNGIEQTIPGYEVNAKANISSDGVSKNFLYNTYRAESLVYEVGDNTPRPFVRQKGMVAAEQLMKLLLGKDYLR